MIDNLISINQLLTQRCDSLPTRTRALMLYYYGSVNTLWLVIVTIQNGNFAIFEIVEIRADLFRTWRGWKEKLPQATSFS